MSLNPIASLTSLTDLDGRPLHLRPITEDRRSRFDLVQEQSEKVAIATQAFMKAALALMAARALGQPTERFFEDMEVWQCVRQRETAALAEMAGTQD